jgi:hypothetical protein
VQAGLAVFVSGKHKGRTIAQVAGDGPDGLSYLGWAASSWKEPDFKHALTTFLQGYVG